MTFSDRLSFSYRYEQHVIWVLQQQGFCAEPFGQAMLSDAMRDQLRRNQTKVRWLPDIVAAGEGQVFYVDAKASTAEKTGNHAVETASTESLLEFQRFSGDPVFYAFPHHNVDTFVPLDEWAAAKWAGNFYGHGSGTPFDLAKCSDVCQIAVKMARGEVRSA